MNSIAIDLQKVSAYSELNLGKLREYLRVFIPHIKLHLKSKDSSHINYFVHILKLSF